MRPLSCLPLLRRVRAGLPLIAIALSACLGATHRATRGTPATPDRLAPDSFVVRFTTTKGAFDVMVNRALAPRGADRVYGLMHRRYYDGARFFRVVPNFVVQFGLAADPKVTAAYKEQRIPDDPVVGSNRRGMVTFATGGPNTRTTQLFINLKDNQRLDASGFAPFGRVVRGMDVVDSLYQGYGEGPPRGRGPSQERITAEGEAYLQRDFAQLDQIRTARVVGRFGGPWWVRWMRR